MLYLFRFTIRDVLWLMVIAALACVWLQERSNSSRLSREREEAIAKWHHASQQWVEATRLIPPQRNNGGIGGGGLSGREPAAESPATDEAAFGDGKKKSDR
jgi:hypothetical protein